MSYKIVSVDGQRITLWDGKTRDPDHQSEPAGLMTLDVGAHNFSKGDTVNLIVQGEQKIFMEPLTRCEFHNAFHVLGPSCNSIK